MLILTLGIDIYVYVEMEVLLLLSIRYPLAQRNLWYIINIINNHHHNSYGIITHNEIITQYNILKLDMNKAARLQSLTTLATNVQIYTHIVLQETTIPIDY